MQRRIDMEYQYTRIDLDRWDRWALFQRYMDRMRIVMSLTVEVVLAFSRGHQLRFYPSMIWVVSKVVNAHDEFKKLYQ